VIGNSMEFGEANDNWT